MIRLFHPCVKFFSLHVYGNVVALLHVYGPLDRPAGVSVAHVKCDGFHMK
jgi:hypothetical protein